MSIKDIVKDNKAMFSHYRLGYLYYDVIDHKTDKKICTVPVNVDDKEDIGHATYPSEMKAITLMRYIRKAEKEGALFICE